MTSIFPGSPGNRALGETPGNRALGETYNKEKCHEICASIGKWERLKNGNLKWQFMGAFDPTFLPLCLWRNSVIIQSTGANKARLQSRSVFHKPPPERSYFKFNCSCLHLLGANSTLAVKAWSRRVSLNILNAQSSPIRVSCCDAISPVVLKLAT